MHISDGILDAPLMTGCFTLAGVGVAAGLTRLRPEEIPRAGILGAVFFTASLIHIPVGPSSVHLLLNGLLGLVLGGAIFPVLAMALFMQALFLGYGGIGALGANILVMAVPGAVVGICFRPLLRRYRAVPFRIGFAAGATAVMLSCALVSLILYLADPHLIGTIAILSAAHLVLLGVEGMVTGAAVTFLMQQRPELFALTPEPVETALPARKPSPNFSLFILFLFLSALPVQAHRVLADAWVDISGTRPVVRGSCLFGDARPAQQAVVTATDAQGKKIAETHTNSRGEFAFSPAGCRGKISIKVNAGEGHLGQASVIVTALPKGSNLKTPEAQHSPKAAMARPKKTDSVQPAAVNVTELEPILARTVAGQIQPLRRELVRLRQKLWLHDILGGIGWIVGLCGLWQFFTVRTGKVSPKGGQA